MSHDRYQSESFEDYMSRGRSVREAREILDRLTLEEARASSLEEYLARIAENQPNFTHDNRHPKTTGGH